MADHAFGAVLYGHDAVVAGPSEHFAEHFINGGLGYADCRVAKVLERRFLGEGTFGAEKGDSNRLL